MLSPLLLIQLPANASLEVVDDGLSAWVPTTQVEDQGRVPVSCLWPGPSLAVCGHRVSEQVDGRYHVSFFVFPFKVDEKK